MKKKLLFLFLFCITISNIGVQAFAQASLQKAKEYELITDKNGQVQKVPAKDSREMNEMDKQRAHENSLYTYYPVTTTNGALTFDFDNPDNTKIVDYIKQNIDVNFDLSIYEAQTPFESKYDGTKTGDGHVKFNFIMNGIKTDVVYTAKIRENIVTEIMLYKTPIYNLDMSQISDTLSDISEEEIKAMAVKEDILKEGFHVKAQELKKQVDTDTMRIYYTVYTIYEDSAGYEASSYFTYGLEE